MDRSFRIVNLNESVENDTDLHWNLCVLCQESTAEVLRDPMKNNNENEDSYSSLAANLKDFHRIGRVPLLISQHFFKEENDIACTLRRHHAKWHKSCRLKYSTSKFIKAQKSAKANKENVPRQEPLIRTRTSMAPVLPQTCMFCKQKGTRHNPLSEVTASGEKSIMDCAKYLGESDILTMGAGLCGLKKHRYHNPCRTKFLNRMRASSGTALKHQEVHEQVLAGLVNQMKAEKAKSKIVPVFKMADLTRQYSNEMQAHGVEASGHSSRLQEDLIQECPSLKATGDSGQEKLVTFKKDLDSSLRENCSHGESADLILFSKTANLIRKDVFSALENSSEGVDLVPESLTLLINMILNGKKRKITEDEGESQNQIATTIADFMVYHIRKRAKKEVKIRRHSKLQETPVPVYIAAKLYGETRKRNLIDIFFQLGICISYDRLQTILEDRALLACERYNEEGAVCPTNLLKGVFTTGAADNIDHDTSSTTAQTCFHGTAISLMQHPEFSFSGNY